MAVVYRTDYIKVVVITAMCDGTQSVKQYRYRYFFFPVMNIYDIDAVLFPVMNIFDTNVILFSVPNFSDTSTETLFR